MKRILIVEDEPDIRESIADMLELADFEPVEASNGEEALSLLANGSVLPDLIISDIMMPLVDGFELFRRVRGRFETVQIPFIFLTALADYDEVRAGMEMGADDYLVKPFNYQQLINAIESRLSKVNQENEYRYRKMIHKLIEIREIENSALAEKLQEISQKVIGLQLLLNLPKSDSTGSHLDATPVSAEIKQDLDESIQLLNPVLMFEHLNLIPLLIWLFKLYAEKGEFKIDVQRAGYAPTFDDDAKLAIFRIVEEILENAVRYSKCHELVVRLRTSIDEFQISVEDDGIGFDVQLLHEKDQGGLLQVIERVNILNGDIDIVSAPQAGVKITISLPMVQVDEQTEADIPDENWAGADVSASQQNEAEVATEIIIAEKQGIVRYGVRELLSRGFPEASLSAVTSENGLLAELTNSSHQVVILDLMLDEAAGFELIKSIRFRFPKVFIIAFSDKEQEMYAAEALRCGANGYLLKSAAPLEFIEAVQTVLRGDQFVSAEIREPVEAYLNGQDWGSYNPVDSLTRREKEILFMVLDGLTSFEISEKLVISKRTVEKHRSNLMNKLGLKSPAELVRLATELGLTNGAD